MNEEPLARGPDGRPFRPQFLPGRPGVEKAGLPTQNRSLHDGGLRTHGPGIRKPKLLDQVREAIRMRHYSIRTEEAYVGWIKRFIFFHGKRHPLEMGQQEITRFLSALAVKEHVSASTQNQALCALLFLYREVLARDIGWLDDVVRARRPRRLPVVLTRQEVRMLLGGLQDSNWIMATLLYGAGLRLLECLRLRVKDIGFETNQIVVREGKGNQDRLTMLPAIVRAPLMSHLERVRALHQQDLERGFGKVYLPDALRRKYPNAEKEWGWQWAFPASRVSVDPRTGERRRHHVDESVLQRAIKEAARRVGMVKPVSTTVVSICLSSREQRQGATLFVVIVVGEPLMPPTPTGPGEDLTHSLLRGQDETPEQSPNLGHAQRDVRPR
jgi:integron integrase